MSENRVIGRDNRLPWHMPADLRHFRRTTAGRTVIMGRRTWESFDGALPGRRNIVITRHRDYRAEGATVAPGLDEALDLARDEPEVFILGGEQVYRLALPLADRIYLTLIHTVVEGDACFPQFDGSRWRLVSEEHHNPDDQNPHPYSFLLYERRPPEAKTRNPLPKAQAQRQPETRNTLPKA